MRVSTATALLSLTVAAAVTAQSPGTPVGVWQIEKVDIAVRSALCAENKGFCVTACGEEKPPRNFCNAETMGWGCGCTLKVPDYSDHMWPVVRTECMGRAQSCSDQCATKPALEQNPCVTSCRSTYDCAGGKSPPSYLRVEDVDKKPDYNGTGVGGNGKSGADSLASSVSWAYTLGALSAVATGMWML